MIERPIEGGYSRRKLSEMTAYRDRRPVPMWVAWLAVASAVATVVCLAAVDTWVPPAIGDFRALDAVWDGGISALEWAVLLPVWKWAGELVLVVGMIVAFAMPRWRDQAPAWLLVAAVHVSSRYVTNWIKVGTGRLWPTEWHGGDTFWHADGISFPSGHVAIFASVALPLAVLVPRLRVPMLVVIGFVMIARVIANAHFVSDVTGGLAVVAGLTWILGLAIRPLSPSRP
jgi:membrane-associated phospholipid phosphatase